MESDTLKDDINFNKGWHSIFQNIVFNITGYTLLDGMNSKRRRGVYLIIMVNYYSGDVTLEYVGSSNNIKRRLWGGPHHVFDDLHQKAKDSNNLKCWIRYIDTSDYIRVEKTLIKSLRPAMNKVHNSGKKP